MKKILLIIAIAFCIFQMVVLATEINIGASAIDRGDIWGQKVTLINFGATATGTGTITSIEIWAFTTYNLANVEVATFYRPDVGDHPDWFNTRDAVTIGAVTAGSKQTITEDSGSQAIALEVEEGDYIGIFFDAGYIERDTSGGAGVYNAGNVDFIPCVNQVFSFAVGYVISLYATGETAVEEKANIILFGTNF